MTNNWRGTVYEQSLDRKGPFVRAVVTEVEETPRRVHVHIEPEPTQPVATTYSGKAAYQAVLEDDRNRQVAEAKIQVERAVRPMKDDIEARINLIIAKAPLLARFTRDDLASMINSGVFNV